MATQHGIIKIKGTIGDISYVKTKDGYIVKEKTSISGARISSDPAFARTRENMAEFGRAGKAGKLLRNAVHILLQNAKDHRVAARLTKAMIRVLQADATSERGQRNIIDGETELLGGFDFNSNAVLSTTLFAPYTANMDRATGALTIDMPSFVPVDRIVPPAGSTHFKIVTAGTEVDFEKGVFVTDSKDSGLIALNGAATPALNLVNTVTANTPHPLFLLLGILFYQQVNGVNYPLKNGAFNALSIVKVSGV